MDNTGKESLKSELDLSVEKRCTNFEATLKKYLAATHKDGKEVEGVKSCISASKDVIFSPQLLWHFDIGWQVDDVNQRNQNRTQCSSDQFGKQYVVICSYQVNDVNGKLDVFEFPQGSVLRLGVERIRYKGLRVITGRWLVAGQPLAVVMDLDSVWWAFDRYRADLMANHSIEVASDDELAREMILFGFMVAQFLADFNYELVISNDVQHRQSKICTSFHEWVTGVGLVLLRDWLVPCSTTLFACQSNPNPNIFENIMKTQIKK